MKNLCFFLVSLRQDFFIATDREKKTWNRNRIMSSVKSRCTTQFALALHPCFNKIAATSSAKPVFACVCVLDIHIHAINSCVYGTYTQYTGTDGSACSLCRISNLHITSPVRIMIRLLEALRNKISRARTCRHTRIVARRNWLIMNEASFLIDAWTNN